MAKPTRCARCGRENDPSFAFCLDCGQPLPRAAVAPPPTPAPSVARCAGCGARLLSGFRFCAQCGRAVPPTGPADAAESPGAPAPSADAAPAPERRGPAAPRPTMALVAEAPPLRITVIRHDGAVGPTFPLLGAEAICGRSEGDLQLSDDATVSPRHARFTTGGGTALVEDLGSVNGTFVRLRKPHRLAVGDEVRLGRQLLRLEPVPRPASADVRPDVHPWGAPDPGHKLRLAQLLEGGGLGEIFPLRAGENTIGREAGDLTFAADRYVSARHARVDVDAEGIVVTDLGSSNGTFVKIGGSTPISAGDQLLVGSQLLRVDEV
jgi:pSer/pThr/pTyr-binding forkhead associated (FHA) protein